jgi:serine/threonine protein kinase
MARHEDGALEASPLSLERTLNTRDRGNRVRSSPSDPDEGKEDAEIPPRIAPISARCELSPDARAFLNHLIRLHLLFPEAARSFLEASAARTEELSDSRKLGKALIAAGLLTGYQLDRVMAGSTHGLVLGNHRILDRLGEGGMGTVFRGEHMFMKRLVAVKVLPVDEDCPNEQLARFYSEMRVLAELRHPNIVMAYDAGELIPTTPSLPTLLYLAMELVDGSDLEHCLYQNGLPSVGLACDWIRQAAQGLQHAHDQNLIHRDIKPSNMLLTRGGQVKLGDFGLVRQFSNRLTDPTDLLGTLEFMAPEQSVDPTNVSSAADIYGLGASLFWVLTGRAPYPKTRTMSEALKNLQEMRPARLRSLRDEVPPKLDELVDRLLDPDPTRRPTLALSVINSLKPFANPSPSLN